MKEQTKFNGAIHTDNRPIFQPNGSLLYALNSMASSKEGDMGSRTNELGNVNCLNLGPGYKIIGHKSIEDKVILFITNGVDSIIGEKDKYCNFTPLINTTCLSFDPCKQIQCEYEIVNGCERVIYFVDGVNKDKAINIDDLDTYKPTGSWDCDLMNIAPDFKYPTIELDVNFSGGHLDLGSYAIAVRYGNSNTNQNAYDIISNPIPVVNYGFSYDQTEGGTVTTVGKISSSIKINLANLDTNYEDVTLIIISTIDGVTSANEMVTLPVSSNLTYTFRGLTPTMIDVPMTELAVDTISFDISKTLKIHDDRLLRANIQEKKIDWAQFQIAANEINVYYKTSANLHGQVDSFGGYKNPKATYKKKSYLRDEVYAFAIVWIFNDGTKSPAFHIPGRKVNEFPLGNTINYTEDPNIFSPDPNYNTNHTRYPKSGFTQNWDEYLPASPLSDRDLTFNPDATERWQVYNTAVRTNVDVSSYGPNIHEGIMGYTESELQYPTTKDCDGVPIYPHTGDGTVSSPYVMDNIRHHRMPDTTLEPHFMTDASDNQFVMQLGVKFINIVPPVEYADQVQGYYIVRSERDDTNKSVVDKGIFYNNIQIDYNGQEFYAQPVGANKQFKGVLTATTNGATTDDLPAREAFIANSGSGYESISRDSYGFHGGLSKFNTDSLESDYVKLETVFAGDVDSYGYVKHGERGRSHEYVDYDEMSNLDVNSPEGLLMQTNINIVEQAVIEPHKLLSSLDKPYVNFASQETYAINVDSSTIPLVNRDHSQGDTILNTDPVGFDTRSICLYGSIKRLIPSQYDQINDISYIQASPNINTGSVITEFSGDTYIDKLSFKKTATTVSRVTDQKDTLWVQVLSMFVESDINTELRHSIDIPQILAAGETSQTTYYPKQDLDIFLRDGDANQFSDGSWDEDTLATVISEYNANKYSKNFYRYNSDYSKTNNIKNYFPLSRKFKFCSDCLNYFPHKIIYSNKSFSDSSILDKRIFLANNSTEIPNKFGEVTNMFTDSDQLWIHAERSLFKQQTKPNELKAGSSTIFLGVGEIFSIPPQQIRTIETGYAGSKHKFATSTTEMGTYFVSAEEGKIFLIQGGNLKEISAEGNRMWFNKNLPMVFEEQYKRLTGNDYTCVEGTADDTSVGFMSAYDRENKRWILHKKDYRVINEESWDPNAPIDFTDGDVYANLSWTISFIGDKLIGWHSYLPNYIFNTQTELFSSKDIGVNNLWKHNEGEYQTYYGVEHDHILEWVNNQAPLNTNVFNNIEYRQSCEKFNTSYNAWTKDGNHTFNKLVAYNDTQSTGELGVDIKSTTYESIEHNPATALAFHKDNLWRVNQLRDMSISTGIPNFTTNWNNIQSTYPIDKVVNNVNIDLSKSQYELARLRGKYLIIRGTFNNPDKTLKLSTEFINTEYDKSVR